MIEITKTHKIYKFLGDKIKIKIKLKQNSDNKIIIIDKNGNKKKKSKIKGLKVNFYGHNSTLILHEPILNFTDSNINFGNDSTVEIKSSKYNARKLKILAEANNVACLINEDFSCQNGCGIMLHRENNLKVTIGKNCMFATNVIIRPSDAHTIYDKDTYEVLNYGKNILIKDNVWLGMNTTVLKGVTIEEGCVIGTGSLVTKSCDEPHSIYAGVPARKIKSNINWSRDSIPDYLEQNRK